MIIKDHAGVRRAFGPLAAIALVAVALVALLLWPGADRAAGDPDRAGSATGPFAAGTTDLAPVAALDTLRLTIAQKDARALTALRDTALEQGVLLHADEVVVPATCEFGGRSSLADVRLKGDLPDHIDTDKWSLRIELRDGKLLGMSRFSIQHPKTRGYLMEWLIMAMARREGLLAPRSTFVNVVINDRPSGIYYLEEHFTKELLEAQGRRDGPIVRFKEDTLWSTWLQYGTTDPPPEVMFAWSQHAAEVAAYEERRLGKVSALNQRLQRALQQMRSLQRKMLENRSMLPPALAEAIPLLSMEAMRELQGQTIDDLFVTDKLGRAMALYTLFHAYHGFAWHQLRFYHDPVLDRLELVVFDTGANPIDPRKELLVEHPGVREFARSDAVRAAAYEMLGRMTGPDWLEGVAAELGPALDRYSAAMIEEGTLPVGFPARAIFTQLRKNCAHIADVVFPRDPANFTARLIEATDDRGEPADVIEVEAWTTTWVPVVIERFSFSNGRSIPAAQAVAGATHRRADGSVILPREGRHLTLRLPADARLRSLRDVQAIKQAIRDQAARDRNVRLAVDVHFRPLATRESRAERLAIRRVEPAVAAGGRPAAAPLLATLDRHECLGYDLEQDRLFVRPGTWDIEGDLLIPDGHALHADGAVRLRFSPGKVCVTSAALRWRGTAATPIVVEASDPSAGWGGLVVLGSRDRSTLHHTVFRDTHAISRGGWQTTGGVTFYRSPVDLVDCRFEHSLGEDALNVFGADLLMERVTFHGGVSDLFDGDFVTGTLRDCTFEDSVGDAVDVSGSRIVVETSRFSGIGDKAISAGERSEVRVRSCTVESAGIAAATKDKSRLEIDGLTVRRATQYALAAYIKKPEYGAATIEARNVEITETGRGRWLIQDGCSAEVDGVALPTTAVDVDDLYRRGILGK